MSDINHTPGPWQLQGEGLVKHPLTGETLLTQRIECGEGWGVCLEILDRSNEPAANAHLIAAAPDLLAELEDIVRLTEITDLWLPSSWLAAAKNAIAKAKGKS